MIKTEKDMKIIKEDILKKIKLVEDQTINIESDEEDLDVEYN